MRRPMRFYRVVIEERCELEALVSARDITEARRKAREGDYDLLPETAVYLPHRVKGVRLEAK